MKVLYIHQYFRKPQDGGALRSYYLAKELVDKGVEVEMVTSHNKDYYAFENIRGIKVHYLPVQYDNSFSFFRRKIAFVLFFFRALIYISKNFKQVDLCYATSTPLTVGLMALYLKKVKKIDYYFEVRDLWPEAPIQLGAIRNVFLKKFLYKMEMLIYKNATKVIALSPGIEQGIRQKAPLADVVLVPNISDCQYYKNEPKQNKNSFYFGVGGKFVLSYIGAIGKVNNLDYVLSLAEECKKANLKNVLFLVAGTGSELENIKKKARIKNLNNVRFLGFLNRKQVRNLLNVTDASIISFLDLPILETNSPNKFFDALASGKLCIVNNQGWTKDLVESHECGFYLSSADTKSFAEIILPFTEDAKLLQKYKNNARKLAEQQFSRTILTQKFLAEFNLSNEKNISANSENSANAVS